MVYMLSVAYDHCGLITFTSLEKYTSCSDIEHVEVMRRRSMLVLWTAHALTILLKFCQFGLARLSELTTLHCFDVLST